MTIPSFPTPPGLSFPVKRTAIWSTIQQQSISGIDTRFQLWTYPRWRYELTFETLRASASLGEWQAMAGFYNSVGGSAATFAFNDLADNSVTAQVFGVGDGTTRVFQLVRALGGFVEPVFLPLVGTFFLNGTPTVALTVGGTGLITFTSAPGAGVVLTWTGTFSWYCRFDEDNVDFSEDFYQFWSLRSLKFTTLKL